MKTLISLFLIIALNACASSYSNTPDYQQFYKTYRSNEGVVSFSFPTGLAGLFMDKDDADVKAFLKKFDEVSFFISEDGNKKLFPELNKHLPKSTYSTIMEIKDGSSTVTFKAKEHDGAIDEIIMTVDETDSFVVMCISGSFTMEDAKKITKSINVDDAIKIQK